MDCAARQQPSKHIWRAYLKMQGSGGHGGSVHLQLEDDSVKMSIHVDDPEGPIRILFEWLGQRIAVKGFGRLLDSERGLKYLGMLCFTIPGGYLETTPSGYIEGMASMMGVTHAKTPTTPGIRPKQPTEAEEKPVDETRQPVKELSRRLQGPREVDYVAAKRMVKYQHGTRDTVLQLLPRKGTERGKPSECDGRSRASKPGNEQQQYQSRRGPGHGRRVASTHDLCGQSHARFDDQFQ